MMPMSPSTAMNTTGASVVGATTILAIFGDYATLWTLGCTFVATFALVTNSVVIKRRADRKEAREVEEFNKRMGKTEGEDDETDLGE